MAMLRRCNFIYIYISTYQILFIMSLPYSHIFVTSLSVMILLLVAGSNLFLSPSRKRQGRGLFQLFLFQAPRAPLYFCGSTVTPVLFLLLLLYLYYLYIYYYYTTHTLPMSYEQPSPLATHATYHIYHIE
jgi:hypothetical protein